MLQLGKPGGTAAVRRTLASTICRAIGPTQVARLRQLRDASTVMRYQPAHQSMITVVMTAAPPALLSAARNTRLKESHGFTCLLLVKADMRVDQIWRVVPAPDVGSGWIADLRRELLRR